MYLLIFCYLVFLSSHTIPRHIICNFRSLFYFIYISVNSWYLNKPDEDWYRVVEISQLNSISHCRFAPAKVFLTVMFSIWSILTDHDLFGYDVEQDWSYTVFTVFFFFALILHSINDKTRYIINQPEDKIFLFFARFLQRVMRSWGTSISGGSRPPDRGGGGGSSIFLDKGRAQSSKFFFRPFGPQFGVIIRGGTGPPGPLPWIRHYPYMG